MRSRTRTALAGTMLSLGASVLAAQQTAMPHGHARRMSDSMMGRSQHMRMMDSMTTRLDSLVARMNAATGEAKVPAMAAVINELVAQRRAMQTQMRSMMDSHARMMDGHARSDSAK